MRCLFLLFSARRERGKKVPKPESVKRRGPEKGGEASRACRQVSNRKISTVVPSPDFGHRLPGHTSSPHCEGEGGRIASLSCSSTVGPTLSTKAAPPPPHSYPMRDPMESERTRSSFPGCFDPLISGWADDGSVGIPFLEGRGVHCPGVRLPGVTFAAAKNKTIPTSASSSSSLYLFAVTSKLERLR